MHPKAQKLRELYIIIHLAQHTLIYMYKRASLITHLLTTQLHLHRACFKTPLTSSSRAALSRSGSLSLLPSQPEDLEGSAWSIRAERYLNPSEPHRRATQPEQRPSPAVISEEQLYLNISHHA